MKVLNSHQVNPFGGLNFVIEEFEKQKIGSFLDKHLPTLSPQCKYQWKDLLYSFWSIFFCGGDCIEDIGINLKQRLSNNPYFQVSSPDRLIDRFKELAIPKDIFTTPRGKNLHHFCINETLASLNVDILKKISLNTTQGYTLDYDNTIIFNKKSDSLKTYKKENGYYPGVGIINDNIVFIENRNGNSSAQDLQYQTLYRMFKELQRNDIKIEVFRADSASYLQNVIHFVSKHTKRFYVKACLHQAILKKIVQITNWEEVIINNQKVYRGDILHTPFLTKLKRDKELHKAREYRLVVTKELRKDGQIDAFTNEAFKYSVILTNDLEMTNDEVVLFYNQRGAIEREFDVLKNDFGWKKLPFSKMEQNTVFLYFTAICRNLYSLIIKQFSAKYKHLNSKDRIKKFIFRFICIPAKWIKSAREFKLRVYGKIELKT